MRIGARQREPHTRRVITTLAVSLLLHIPALGLLSLLNTSPEPFDSTSFNARREFSVNVMNSRQLAEIEKKEKKKKEELDGQVVSMPPPDEEETPEEAKFLDRYDSKTEEEQVKKLAPGYVPPSEAARKAQKKQDKTAPSEQESAKQAENSDDDWLAREDGSQGKKQEAGMEGAKRDPVIREERSVAREGAKEGQGEKIDPTALFPKAHQVEVNKPGEGGSFDYLRDVADGDRTLLNRKTTRYWAFFNRVKSQVAEQWKAGEEYRKRDPYGNVYGVKDRYSIVQITLNPDGTVRQLYLERDSGLDFIDDEAVRAIRAAAPFHNPPEGLKNEEGLVHFRFGFYLEIGSGNYRFMPFR
jgi:TonB family protein